LCLPSCRLYDENNVHLEITFASGGQGALFEKTAPWTPAKAFV
jgi:hypothetical protein